MVATKSKKRHDQIEILTELAEHKQEKITQTNIRMGKRKKKKIANHV